MKTQTTEQKQYAKLVDSYSPKSPMGKNIFNAFWVGGLICCIGQGIKNAALYFGASEEAAGTWCSIILILLGAILTGTGIYNRIGKFAGAGSIVPITGFSNSVVSPAMEFKQEGWVMGVGSKLFTIAGPVLVCGISTSVIAGVIYCIVKAVMKLG